MLTQEQKDGNRLALETIWGVILGVAIGIAVTAVWCICTTDTPQNPGAKAATILSVFFTVPIGAFAGGLQGFLREQARQQRRKLEQSAGEDTVTPLPNFEYLAPRSTPPPLPPRTET
jgi:hypothetical protein